MSHFDEEDDEQSFFARNRGVAIVLGVALVGGGGFAALKFFKPGDSGPARPNSMVMVALPPLPPPPPPPPPPPQQPPPPQEQKMEEQDPVKADEPEPEAPKPADEPPALGTGIKGDGPPDGFGLSGRDGNRIGGGLGGRGGDKRRWFASRVQSRVQEVLRTDKRTRSLSLSRVQVRIWQDTSGRVTRAQAVDAGPHSDAISTALNGVQLDPPPQDTPSPVVLRISALRP